MVVEYLNRNEATLERAVKAKALTGFSGVGLAVSFHLQLSICIQGSGIK